MLTFRNDYKKAYKELEHYADEHFCDDIIESILDACGGNRVDVESALSGIFE